MSASATPRNSGTRRDNTHLTCKTCQRVFSRLEHLRRHAQVHDTERPHRCTYCGRTFARKDAARRHEQGHKPQSENNSKSQTICRTCCSCAEARVKCSGGTPCNYCSLRNFNCIYRLRKRKKSLYHEGFSLLSGIAQIPDENLSPVSQSASDNSSVALSDSRRTPEPSSHAYIPERNQDIGPSDHIPPLSTSTHLVFSNAQFSPTLAQNNRDFSPWLDQSVATNWLPFDQSNTANLNTSLGNNETTQACAGQDQPASTSTNSGMTFSGLTQNPAVHNGLSLQHDRVTALIASMNIGLSGPSDTGNLPRPGLVTHERGKLYADGAGARISQSDRRATNRGSLHNILNDAHGVSPSSTSAWLDHVEEKLRHSSQYNSRFQMPDNVFEEMISKVALYLCASSKDVLSRKKIWELFIQLYFDNFHRFHPFLDRSLLCIPVWGWTLCLATSAIGTRYAGMPEVSFFGDSLCSALHEILLKELDFGRIEDSLPYIQARALAAIGLCHSHNSSMLISGYNAVSLLYNSCQRLRLLDEDDRIGAAQPGQDLEQVWIAWRFRETRRRTGLFIWIADYILAAMSGSSPRLPLKCMKLILPSAEDLWEADTCEKWFAARGLDHFPMASPDVFDTEQKSRPSVQESVHRLWTDLQAPKLATDFATTAMIHVLIRRMWDAVRYFEDPAYAWSQMPASPRSEHSRDSANRYIASIPEFSKWRNGTCDCLDVLHWDALGLSAKSGGHEGPVFLQLHLARLLILAPIMDLIGQIQGRAGTTFRLLLPHDLYCASESEEKRTQMIAIWAREDRYKARLAVIHAGATFWHVRRYPSESFVQPFAIFLAAIVLWAYGTYSKPKELQSHLRTAVEGDDTQNAESTPQLSSQVSRIILASENRMPNFIQLDRPMDDELVQHFIRSGERMRLFLEGVPDLCNSMGPIQILQEAVVILREAAGIWTIAGNYAQCLDTIILAHGERHMYDEP